MPHVSRLDLVNAAQTINKWHEYNKQIRQMRAQQQLNLLLTYIFLKCTNCFNILISQKWKTIFRRYKEIYCRLPILLEIANPINTFKPTNTQYIASDFSTEICGINAIILFIWYLKIKYTSFNKIVDITAESDALNYTVVIDNKSVLNNMTLWLKTSI